MFSPLLEGEQALASMLKLSGCYVGFLLLLFDCVHTKDFRKHRQAQNNVLQIHERTGNVNSKPLGPRKGTIHVMCVVKNSLLGFGSSIALTSASFGQSDVGETGSSPPYSQLGFSISRISLICSHRLGTVKIVKVVDNSF